MKKLLCLMLMLALLCAPFAGCGNDDFLPPPESISEPESTPEGESSGTEDITKLPVLNICVDGFFGGDSLNRALEQVPGNGREFLPIVERVAVEGPERETTLTRLRTELMAGAGPDLFICRCDTQFGTKPLFPFPRLAMKNRLFLPLDSYLQEARYMEWDHLLPVIMEAGRDEEGQQVLPLLYQIPVTFFPKGNPDYALFAPLPENYQELLDSDDPVLRFVAADSTQYDSIFGELIDYDKGEPTFTEEELLEQVLRARESLHQRQKGEFPAFTWQLEEQGMYVANEDIGSCNFLFGFLSEMPVDTEDYTLVPLCSRQGGVTATITEFMAINRNSAQPEIAFRVMDWLMSDQAQSSSFVLAERSDGITPNFELGQKDEAHRNTSTWQNGRGMNSGNFAQLREIQGKISAVNFYTAANELGYSEEVDPTRAETTQEEIEKMVHENYMELQMMLAES